MHKPTIADDDITPEVLRLAGRTSDDPELQTFLEKSGAWPLKPFPAGEFNLAFKDELRSYELLFEDAATVQHAAAAGKPARLPLFVGAYYFNEGSAGQRPFAGILPHGVTWHDTPDQLLARLGAPKNTITAKKTGALSAHRWAIEGLLLTVGYRHGVVEDVYVGIT